MLRTIADSLVAVLLAPACAACETPLDEPLRGPVCARCWTAVTAFTPPLCERCSDPLPSWRVVSVSAGRCPRCRRRASAISTIGAIGPYEGPLRKIVHALKYAQRRSLAVPLGAMLALRCAAVLDGADAVVPVPLHWRRQQQRGFNQADDLASSLGLPPLRVLRRTRATPSQTDLAAASRHANVRGAFALRPAAAVRDMCLVLVDDVSTTGATLEACARVLREAGAREVRAVTAARAVAPPR